LTRRTFGPGGLESLAVGPFQFTPTMHGKGINQQSAIKESLAVSLRTRIQRIVSEDSEGSKMT